MAVHLKHVQQALQTQTDWAFEAERHIDSKLSNPQYVRDWVCNEAENPTWRFAVPGIATEGDKQYVTRKFQEAGWGSVEVTNSGENGERPGMAGVILYTYPLQGRHHDI